mgnify:CR=1 FL=1
MIINTGQRTDIPGFYAEWFAGRLREGYVCVRNPYNPQQVSRYRLDPTVVDVIGFCTKNPAPMFRYMDLLRDYGQFWYVSITPYGREIEGGVPDKHRIIEDFKKLSEMAGKNAVGWRYDPIFLSDVYTADYHIRAFRRIAEELAGYTDSVVISFIDLYSKVRRNFPEAREVSGEDAEFLGREMAHIASECQMTLRPCAEGSFLSKYGADCSGCMTIPIYEKAIGKELAVDQKKENRSACACYLACDIGAYDTCMHLCRYCYANGDAEKVRKNYRRHDPKSPFITGGYEEGDIIHDAEQRSWINNQMSIDDFCKVLGFTLPDPDG